MSEWYDIKGPQKEYVAGKCSALAFGLDISVKISCCSDLVRHKEMDCIHCVARFDHHCVIGNVHERQLRWWRLSLAAMYSKLLAGN